MFQSLCLFIQDKLWHKLVENVISEFLESPRTNLIFLIDGYLTYCSLQIFETQVCQSIIDLVHISKTPRGLPVAVIHMSSISCVQSTGENAVTNTWHLPLENVSVRWPHTIPIEGKTGLSLTRSGDIISQSNEICNILGATDNRILPKSLVSI